MAQSDLKVPLVERVNEVYKVQLVLLGLRESQQKKENQELQEFLVNPVLLEL